MADKYLQTFITIVKKYYPDKEIMTENNTVWVNGYLGGLLRYLSLEGCGKRFTFVQYLIEYVRYTEALDTTDKFIDDLVSNGMIYQDPEEKDLYRVSDTGFKILEKVNVDGRLCKQ